MTVHVSLKEIVKLPRQRWQAKKTLGFEEEDIPVALQNIQLPDLNPGHEPFLLTLVVNDLLSHNYMLDSGACANIMPLKVMKQMNLSITHRYKAACGFNSQPIEVEGLIKDLKVSLAMNHDISLLMDVVVINIHDVWGMLYQGNGVPLWVVNFKWTYLMSPFRSLMGLLSSFIENLHTLPM